MEANAPASPWERLSLFESHDYVRRWFSAKHQRDINAQRTKEITSCFVQGREYFASAGQAAPSVRPLLLYYGALSLARGLILSLNPQMKNESLKPGHGLEAVEWQQTLSGGIQNVLDLGVRARRGTFSELAAAVGNSQPTAWRAASTLALGYYHAEYDPPKFVADTSIITLDDLVSRDYRFLSIYDVTTERPTKVHIGEGVFFEPAKAQVSLYATRTLTPEIIRTGFGFPSATIVRDRNGAHVNRLVANFFVDVLAGDPRELQRRLPATQYDRGTVQYVVEDFPNGDRLSDFLRTYLIAYILGMLVRYFPSHWISLLRNEKGDAAQPLLIASMESIERNFPSLVRAQLH